jgi:hypothetical protein
VRGVGGMVQPPLFAASLTDVTKANERTAHVIDEHTRGGIAEPQLTVFVERRGGQRRKTEGERRVEEAWAASERRYFARIEEERRRERLAYHEDQATRLSNVLGSLVAYHEAEAMKYQPKGAA